MGEQRIAVDAKFPGRRWDGLSAVPLACELGEDHLQRGPGRDKQLLERELRESFRSGLSMRAYLHRLPSQDIGEATPASFDSLRSGTRFDEYAREVRLPVHIHIVDAQMAKKPKTVI